MHPIVGQSSLLCRGGGGVHCAPSLGTRAHEGARDGPPAPEVGQVEGCEDIPRACGPRLWDTNMGLSDLIPGQREKKKPVRR